MILGMFSGESDLHIIMFIELTIILILSLYPLIRR
jgi:hypothetical protein